jgi:hypothetical protein
LGWVGPRSGEHSDEAVSSLLDADSSLLNEASNVPDVFRFILKLMRLAFFAAFGIAIAAKFLLESNADAETEEIDLVSIFEGKHLISAADPFYGGKITSMFAGVLIDLRKAQPAPTGIDLDLAVLMGGVSVVVPEGWRVQTNGRLKVIAGGFSDNTKTTANEDVPIVNVRGFIAMGGFQATTKSPVEAVSE